jgi:predicted transcriptional regulator
MPTPFKVRLDGSTLNALDQLAKKTERYRSWLIARAVENFVGLNAPQIEKIEAGLEAAIAATLQATKSWRV